MKTIKIFLVFMFVATLFFIPSFALAGGGIEPGSSCGVEGVKYDGPPLIGDVELTIQDDNLIATGFLERKGNPGCIFPVVLGFGAINSVFFSELKGTDIKGFCLDEIINISQELDIFLYKM